MRARPPEPPRRSLERALRLCLSGLLPVALLLAAGCGDGEQAKRLERQRTVLARVGDRPVTQADLERAAAQALGPGTLRRLDEEARRNLLESVVLNRAMAQQMEGHVEPERLAELDASVAAYREKLLAQEYVRNATKDVMLTDAVLEKYYREHLDQFGQRELRRYELLRGGGSASGGSTSESLALLGKLARQGAKGPEWGEYARRAEVRSAGIRFTSGELTPDLFEPRVRNLIEKLAAGQVSDVGIIDRVPYLARVTALETRPARPFAEVRSAVFEAVRAVELKAAIQRLKGQVLAQVGVEYTAPETKPVASRLPPVTAPAAAPAEAGAAPTGSEAQR